MSSSLEEAKAQAAQTAKLQALTTELHSYSTWTSQFCVRGAALILSGRSEEAEQYQAKFGECISRTVKAYVTK